jgi:hypothetical protein
MRSQHGCLRERHWHATAAELAYVVSGSCRTTVLSPDGAAPDAFGSADVRKQSPVLRATLFFTLVLPPLTETAADCWIAAPLSLID